VVQFQVILAIISLDYNFSRTLPIDFHLLKHTCKRLLMLKVTTKRLPQLKDNFKRLLLFKHVGKRIPMLRGNPRDL